MNITSTATRAKAIGLGLVVAMFASLLAAPAPTTSKNMVEVIIRTVEGASLSSTIERMGGTVTGSLNAIDALTADLPASAVATIARTPGVMSVTQNSTVELAHHRDSESSNWVEESSSTTTRPTTLSVLAETVRADRANRYGYTGSGVTVALIDSGVAPVTSLKSRIVNGPDLSFDSQLADLQNLDAYGHGTHMAGIIGAIAPSASILNVKVGAADGSVDVSQVLAAINWVIEHRNDNDMNVRVLNLSFGTNSTQAYTIDPLAYAVETAWRKGIVVIVASGNDSNSSPVRSPATSPLVIAVGAVDTKGTTSTWDDRIAAFSNCGTNRTVDLVAPGRSIASVRVPGSNADQKHPEAREAVNYFRGSGTSQSAAVVSGIAALVVGAHPEYTPDQVKAALRSSATDVPYSTSACKGAGMVSARAIMADSYAIQTPQDFAPATGLGSLEAARGTDHLENDNVVLKGEIDIFGNAFNGSTWSGSTWSGSTWSAGLWNGSTWSGSTWSGSTWSGSTWSGSTWSGSTWSGSTWSDAYWTGSTWSGSTWSASNWTGSTWSGSNWTGLTWDHGKRIR